jgi:hypothetical protein
VKIINKKCDKKKAIKLINDFLKGLTLSEAKEKAIGTCYANFSLITEFHSNRSRNKRLRQNFLLKVVIITL